MVVAIACLSASVLLNVSSSLLIKLSSASRGAVAAVAMLLGLGCGAGNVLFYSRALGRIRLNVAYPALSAGSLVLLTLLSALIYSERLSAPQLLGMALVLGGMTLVVS